MRYHKWTNYAGPGYEAFVTTTALDFVHVFRQDHLRDKMAHTLLNDCRKYKTVLHAFVVMPHHIHFLVRCPDQHDISWLVQRIKSNSALAIKPLLSEATERGFDEQRGLNGRSFWKKSFRSVVVCSPSVFRQKVNYIHRNPVRAGYVESSDQYRWSSKRFMLQGLWTPEFGLDIEAVLRAWD